MRHAVAPAVLALALCGCANHAGTRADESPIAFAAVGARSAAVNDGIFGEWVSQIIRTPSKAPGQAASYSLAAIYDETLHESRPMLALSLADDGTFSLISNYSSTSRSIVFGNWSMTGTRIALEQGGEVTWVFISSGGKLIAEKSDGPTIILGRK